MGLTIFKNILLWHQYKGLYIYVMLGIEIYKQT